MTKIDIFSGFLGAGKTTLIKKLIKEAYKGENLVLIENEFGEIGVDGGFLQEAGIKINELNSGCICCSLVGDFAKALNKVYADYKPDRILIEPSGVGKLSDVIRAVESANLPDSKINTYTTVVDANKCKMYMKNFGEFFNDQVDSAACIIFSHADVATEQKLNQAVELVRGRNAHATIVTTAWNELDGGEILSAMEHSVTLNTEMEKLTAEVKEHKCCHHDHEDGECHHEHNHDDEHKCCHHDHNHEEGECHHEHSHDDEHKCCHHDHDHEEGECHHEHNHDDEHKCCHHDHDHEEGECHHEHSHDDEHKCCHHDHDHEEGECHHEHSHEHGHHHHHADDIFTSWGVETGKKYTKSELEELLSKLSDAVTYGTVLRAKGIVDGKDGKWLHFDYVPNEIDVREGGAAYTGRLCVIGSRIDEEELKELFGV